MTHSWPSSSWPIGTRVRWRPEIAKTAWVGEVTGHPHPRMVETDGRGRVSIGLLERVGEMQVVTLRADLSDPMQVALSAEVARLTAENATLTQVVEQQMEAIGDAQAAHEEAEKECDALRETVDKMEKQIEDAEAAIDQQQTEWGQEVEDLVSNLCLALGYGRNPLVPTGIPELDALVRHVLP